MLSTLLLPALFAAAPVLVTGARYDEAVPTLRQIVGHDLGERVTDPQGVSAYLHALAAAAPLRARLLEYGRSEEGRPLEVLVLGSPERIAHLEEVKAELRRLAEPRGLSEAEAERLLDRLPAVVWLIHAVHGNELSSAEAGLALAHHLLAARDDEVAELVRGQVLLLIDPLQNPDGRARFVASFEQARGPEPDSEPVAAEHDEPWPGGRGNHYLFDMNRDWFAQTQPETRGRLRVFADFHPHVVVDLHEMNGDSTYFFAPPALPINPVFSPAQRGWLDAFGRAIAERFDAAGEAYFVREVFDSFYPGYGESWPMAHGAVGMTFEQASARGLLWRRPDDSELSLLDGIRNHFRAALATVETAARGRRRLLQDHFDFRRSAVREGGGGPVRQYVVHGGEPARRDRLAGLLQAQGVEVRVATEELRDGERRFPAGSLVVPLAQPAGRLARSLLEPTVSMDEAFVKEQERRRRKRLPDQIYDVTGWSLPLLFGLECVPTGVALAGATTPRSEPIRTQTQVGPARVAWLLPWSSATAEAVVTLLREGVKVQVAESGLRVARRSFPAGTAVVRVAGNREDARERLEAVARARGTEVVPVDTGFVEEGISFGSERVRRLQRPRVLLVWDRPASSQSAGWARWVLERRFGQRVTAARAASLAEVDLRRFDVLVLPSGRYEDAFGEKLVRRIAHWVEAGGTLIALGDAARWLTRDDVSLLSTRTELKDGAPETEEEKEEREKKPPATRSAEAESARERREPYELERAILPERERPDAVPGALLKVDLDTEHWLAAGSDGQVHAVVEGRRVFSPLRLDEGTNVGVYAKRDDVVASGLVWDDARELRAQKAFLMHQPHGQGHVIGFAEDPNYRGYAEATELLFMNAVLLGPAY